MYGYDIVFDSQNGELITTVDINGQTSTLEEFAAFNSLFVKSRLDISGCRTLSKLPFHAKTRVYNFCYI